MILMRTGYYCEMHHGEADDPSIFEAKKVDYSEESLRKILGYLRNGIVIAAASDYSQDVINYENGIAGCPDALTDGKWLWPGDLQYYVKNYSIALDPDFINTMINNNWQTPISEDEIDYDNLEVC